MSESLPKMSKERAAYQDYTIRVGLLPPPAKRVRHRLAGPVRRIGKEGLVFVQHMSAHWVPRGEPNVCNEKQASGSGTCGSSATPALAPPPQIGPYDRP